jgi:hypothetical protein
MKEGKIIRNGLLNAAAKTAALDMTEEIPADF